MSRAPDRPCWRLSVLQLAQLALLLPLAALIRALVRGCADFLALPRRSALALVAPLALRSALPLLAPLPAVLLDEVGASAP